MKTEPKNGEYWVVDLNDERQVVSVYRDGPRFYVYPCGDEEGWSVNSKTTKLKWVRRVRI